MGPTSETRTQIGDNIEAPSVDPDGDAVRYTFRWQKDGVPQKLGEASGEAAFNHVMAMCGFPRDRKPAEYAGTFAEAQYVLDRLKEYGLADAAVLRFPGGDSWDGVKGELWEVKPGRQKLASYVDLTAMLASGSNPADVTAEQVWVEEGEAKDFEGLDVKDKILVTSGSAGAVHNFGCLNKGAAGVISFSSPRPPR